MSFFPFSIILFAGQSKIKIRRSAYEKHKEDSRSCSLSHHASGPRRHVTSYADYDYAANAKVFHSDYSGKTVILHSNDVHGALDGYAYMTELKNEFLAAGATEVILVDAGDFSQGTPYVSSSKGASGHPGQP